MNNTVFKKNIIYRISAYLLLLPFIPAVRPILNIHTTVELLIFIGGFLLTLLLIIYSNNKPYIVVTDKNLLIFLMYRHKPEIHMISSIEKLIKLTDRKLLLQTEGFDSLVIRLTIKEQMKFIELMEEKNIYLSKA
ncbi:MAG: hypothetical protein JEY91_10275 [Spirochaetaceae bacterium]|nr:hypothetical protein [Spirochaetaceae bacterium]